MYPCIHPPSPQATGDASKQQGGGRGKHVSDHVALLKKALAGETAAAAAAAVAAAAGMCPPLDATGCGAPTAEDEDAVSALFELSASAS